MSDIEGGLGQRQIAAGQGKGDRYRAMPLGPRLETVIGAYLQDPGARFPSTGPHSPKSDPLTGGQPPDPILVDAKGEAMSIDKLEYLVERDYAAGINSHRAPGALIHALRHTFATRLVENGVSAVELIGLLGHCDLQTTQRNVARRPDHLRASVAANPGLGHM